MSGMLKKIPSILILMILALCLTSGFAFAITWTPAFTSSTHTVSQTSTNASVTVSWSAMSPTATYAADSYTYVWDHTSDTSITATKSPTETISGNLPGLTVTRTLTDGAWYLHMRAVDTGGNWTATSHFGPVVIDTTPAPTVTAIEPASGVNSSDTISVTITGTNFKKLDGTAFTNISAKISTIALTSVTVNSATSITATYPIKNRPAGTKDVTVTTDWGTSVPLSGGFTVTNPAPTISSISPTSASNAAEKSVTITGTGFLSTATTPPGTASPTVQMKDPDNPTRNFSLTSVTVVSTTSITATVPAAKTVGTYDVVVTNSDGKSATKTDAFVVKLPAPTISTVTPASGTNEKTTTITVTGTNFQTSGTTVVTLEASGKDTITCTSVVVATATQLSAVVPKDKATGTYTLKVTNPDSQSATKASAFTINNPVATVTSITPSSMTNNTTQSVTVVGTNFRSGLSVKIGTTECTGVTLDASTPSTKLTCTVPAAITPGTYNVVVTNVGASPGTLSSGFTVNAATTTVALSYSASDTTHVSAGDLIITATFTQSQSAAPTISIDQQGSEDVSDASMSATADGTIWTYTYPVTAADGSLYIDGSATVTIKNSGGTTISITGGATFTIDTVALSAAITYAQGTNTTGPFKAGALTISVTLNTALTNPPKISINQQGSTDIVDDTTFSGSGTDWDFTYTVETTDGTTYKDGVATVSLKNQDDGDAAIPIGSGSTFTIDTTPPTVALTYAQGTNTAGPFKAGNLVITATFSEVPKATPQIAIDQPGSADIAATSMSATASTKVFNHTYAIQAATGGTYIDGSATVAITNGGDAASNSNATATNNTFGIDTVTAVAIDAVTTPTATNSQVVTGTKEAGSTVAIGVTAPVTAGTVFYPGGTAGTTWSCTISSLQEGANSITATATDASGNTAEDVESITYDAAPQVTSATYVDSTHVDVLFNEAVTGATTASRYTIAGLTVSAVADQGSNTYRLTTSAMTAGQTYTVVVASTVVDSTSGTGIDAAHNSATYNTVIFGDVDNSGLINVFDVIKIARASLGLENTGTFISAAADITKDGNINVFDVIKAARLSLGLD